MPRKSPAKRRRESKLEEDEEEESNPKNRKTQKVQTTPTQEAAPSNKATNPPPVQLHSNPKVSASAVKGMPPPPIAEEQNGDDDDMVPPTMNLNNISSSNKARASSKSKKQPDYSPGEVEEEEDAGAEENEEEMEPEDTPSSGSTCFNLLLVLLLIGLGVSAGFVHQRIVSDLQTQLKGYQQDLQHAEGKMATLIQEERKQAAEQIENIRGELIDLVHEIRYVGRQQLKSKYGPGPIYQVELALEFPAAEGDDGEVNVEYMTIDLDGENMPHAVLTFMSQVEAGLYNTRGFGFHHSGDHIVFGSPMGLDEYSGNDFGQVWEDSGVDRLLFQEHSEVVPHVPYTIGFSGRGPNLYFNMMDNTEAHRDARDPCFGTISRGTNLADWMHSLAGTLNPGDWKEMEADVMIRSATILRP